MESGVWSLLLLHRDAKVPVAGGADPSSLQLPPLPPALLVRLHVPKAFLAGAAGPRAQLAQSNLSSNAKRKHRIFRKVPEFSENFQYFQNFSKIFQEIAKIVDIVNDMNAALAREVKGLKQYRFIYLFCYTKGFARKLSSLDHHFLCHLYDRSRTIQDACSN